ncbi:unnamed protein product [Symbiodinium sp. CCMP2592]|nr:unnamed protein product [Symbiodinium sp. CCMP2592]
MLALGKYEEAPFSVQAMGRLRRSWFALREDPAAAALQEPGQPFFLEALSQTCRAVGDEDWEVLTRAEDNYARGRRLGVDRPFPRVAVPEQLEKQFEEEEALGFMYPLSEKEELTEILDPHWIPVRRFAIFQQGKLRCIDDLSENSVNSSWEVAEKIDLRAIDELLWITSRLMQSIVDRGFVNLRLSSGEVISDSLHTVWRTQPESARSVLKCVDLKSAHKQYAIRPCDSKRCVVSLQRPSDGQAVGFISHTLPFGSLASVGLFNRVARLIHCILIELDCLACNYYDDYPVLDVSMLSANTEKTIRKLMCLLGVICSKDKELPFSSVADLLEVRLVVVREVDSLFGRIQCSGVHRLSSTDREAFAVLQMRMDAGEPRRIQVRYFGVTLSDSLVDLWAESGKKHLIGLVELYALVLARFVWGRLLDDRRVLYFIDHVGVLAATINCTSRDELWRTLLIHLERADAKPCIGWYARVPSQSNPADPPSRGCWIFPMCEHAIRDHPACFATGELLRSS